MQNHAIVYYYASFRDKIEAISTHPIQPLSSFNVLWIRIRSNPKLLKGGSGSEKFTKSGSDLFATKSI
jgi:hypothetical protein